MWGQIFVEASIQQNFNFGFSTHKSDILLHLSQWQYWWWFWFSLVWVAYYYIIIYCVTKRTFLFNPVINTSIRGHGKWGDFLVAIIPLSWCGNILVNSNFILRMIEWQNESSLFTLRVQGKQWYWVYKFDAAAASAIYAAPKNIGHNKWLSWVANDVYVSDSYYQAVHLAAQLESQDTYKTLTSKAGNSKISLEANTLISNKLFTSTWDHTKKIEGALHLNNFLLPGNDNNDLVTDSFFEAETRMRNISQKFTQLHQKFNYLSFGDLNLNYFNLAAPKSANTNFVHYDLNRIDDVTDTMGNIRMSSAQAPLRLLKTPLNLFNLNQLKNKKITNSLLSLMFNDTNDNPALKVFQTETLWGFRQKKYKRLKKFMFQSRFLYDPITLDVQKEAKSNLQASQRNLQAGQFAVLPEGVTYSLKDHVRVYTQKDFFKKNTNSDETFDNILEKSKERREAQVISTPFDLYKSIRNAKQRTDLLSVTLARRLLRVKRTLVLPAHVNITVITNSYDVVHSWFIPGLGIKMDCVPGRSTHHTFYVDNIGFYYGQCAEICGRYHHHMPIRICALSFEQFLVWWHKKGLPRLKRLNVQGQWDHPEQKYYNKFHLNGTKKPTPPKLLTKYKYNW